MTPRRRAIVEGIMIDVAVPGVEAVVARPCATVAPMRETPRRSEMPSAIAVTRTEVRSLRGNGAGEDGRHDCDSKDRSLQGDTHQRTAPLKLCGYFTQARARWQITTTGVVKRRPMFLLNYLFPYLSGRVSGNTSTISLVIAFTISTWSFMVTYL